MKLVAFRTLEAVSAIPRRRSKAFAAEYTVQDGPNADGEMFERAGHSVRLFPVAVPE